MTKPHCLSLFISFLLLFNIESSAVEHSFTGLSLVSITPSNESTEVARDANIIITFDQPVFQGETAGATLLLINNTEATSERTLTPASAEITGWGTSTITIDFGAYEYAELNDYYVYSFNGFFEDASNITYDIPNETAIFTTTGIPPSIVSIVPADEATNVSVNLGSYVLTASEDLQISSSPGVANSDYYIEILYNGNTLLVKSFDVTDTNDVEVSGNQITLKNIPQLLPGVTYTVRYWNYISKPFEDTDGYKLPSFNNSTAFTFTTDGTPPVASSTYPSDESTFASLGAAGNIVFSELVEYGTGSIALYKANGTLVESIPVSATGTDSRLNLASSYIANWNFDTDLEELTDYYILVEEGSYVDLNGNEFAGIGLGELDFTSNARPHISSLSPVDGATDVDLNTTITIDFDVDINVDDPAELVIKNYDTDEVVETFDLTTMGDVGFFENGTITLTPSQNLPANTHLFVEANPVGSIDSDLNGESFLGLDDKDDWDFTTIPPDLTAPEILSVTEIADGTYENYTLFFTITFDENIVVDDAIRNFELGIVSPNVKYNFSSSIEETTNNSITFKYEGLRNGWTYYILIDSDAITDVAGNAFSGVSSSTEYQFLASWEAPEVLSQSPMASANQPVDTDIVLEFDEDIKINGSFPTEGTAIRINNKGDNSVLETYEVGDITINGSTLTITRSSELDLGSSYFIFVPTGLITATADTTRFFGGYVNTSAWAFGTEYNFWDGASWKDGTPVAGDNITLKADYAFSAGEVLDAGLVYINDGVTLTVENNGTLRHTSNLYNYGDLIIESGASLNSQDNVTSYDDAQVTIRRNTTGGTSDGAYSFIGVPFYGVNFSSINGGFKYQYDQSTNSYADASSITNMIGGRGYTLANNDFIEVSGSSPINGDISIGVLKSSTETGYNLVSNPYTAAISYAELMAAEGPDGTGDITSTIYLWDDAGNSSKNQSEFITVNSLGSVSGGSGRSGDFNGHIGVAQGFFVESTQAITSLNFTDAMKVNGNNTDQSYFRKADNETIKLALKNDKGVHSEVLLGWKEDALVGYDTRYDARKFLANNESYLYMPCEALDLVIQGLPLSHDQPIPLGFYSTEASTYSIELVDQFSKKEIMLFDRFTQQMHDLSRSSYSFNTTEGLVSERFELIANQGVLSTNQMDKPLVYVSNGQLNTIDVVQEEDVNYQIITISGKIIKAGTLTNPNHSISVSDLNSGVYLFLSNNFHSKFIVE